jgi:hypothetical protein
MSRPITETRVSRPLAWLSFESSGPTGRDVVHAARRKGRPGVRPIALDDWFLAWSNRSRAPYNGPPEGHRPRIRTRRCLRRGRRSSQTIGDRADHLPVRDVGMPPRRGDGSRIVSAGVSRESRDRSCSRDYSPPYGPPCQGMARRLRPRRHARPTSGESRMGASRRTPDRWEGTGASPPSGSRSTPITAGCRGASPPAPTGRTGSRPSASSARRREAGHTVRFPWSETPGRLRHAG